MTRSALSIWKALRLRRAARLVAAARYGEADRLLSDEVARAPREFDLRVRHAFCAHHAGSYVEALARWGHIRLHWPGYAMAWSGYAANARELDCLAAAREAIDEALRRFPSDLIAISEAIRVYDRLGDPVRSLELSAEMVRLGPDHLEWRRDHKARLADTARSDQAKALTKDAPAGGEDAAGLALCRARIASRRGAWAEADRHLGACVPTGAVKASLVAHLRRVALDLKLHHPHESSPLWAHVVRLSPDDATARHHLVDTLIRCGRYAEAGNEASEALRAFPGDDDLLFDAAHVALKAERWDEALAGFDALLRRRPDHDAAQHCLSRARMGRAQAGPQVGEVALQLAAERQDVGLVAD